MSAMALVPLIWAGSILVPRLSVCGYPGTDAYYNRHSLIHLLPVRRQASRTRTRRPHLYGCIPDHLHHVPVPVRESGGALYQPWP
ncbi:hypothetical protein BGW80DRAFT_1408137 [Lactifluus volemus]|nr:hypothetical protein BGW80DRAFT_1408137 [Lactifluus volemus]